MYALVSIENVGQVAEIFPLMTAIPRLSVVIPVRNGSELAGRAIASAQAIPIAPLEIVVVDDGSSDDTPEALRRLAAHDPRVVLIRRDRDHGAAAARNAGVDCARADIVCFLDSDDVLYAEPVARRLAWHEAHPKIVFSFADHNTLLPDGTVEPRFAGYWPRFEKFLNGRRGMIELGRRGFDLLFGENPVCTTGAMARRDALTALGGFAPELRMSQDWDLWTRLARRGDVAYSTEVEGRHTVRAGSLSGDFDDRARYNAEVLRRHWGFALRRSPATALASLSLIEVAHAERERAAGRNVSAWRHYLVALAVCPNRRQGLDFLRATAVLAGVRGGEMESFEDRARLAALNAAEDAIRRPTTESAAANTPTVR